MTPNEAVQQVGHYLRAAQKILIFTGAGVSTGSGIQDYRGPQGVWKTRQPVYYADFMNDAAERTRYWQMKLSDWPVFQAATPNAVHRAIVDLAGAEKLLLTVTQNVDGLHRAAGLTDEQLIELHGTNLLVECQSCGQRSDPEAAFAEFERSGEPPVCPCGGYLKSATISFGQNLRTGDLDRAYVAAQETDLVIALGSTLQVEPAASICPLAAQGDVPYLIINRGETAHDALSCVTLRIEGDVNATFPPAVEQALTEQE